jgi:hypothetical protein
MQGHTLNLILGLPLGVPIFIIILINDNEKKYFDVFF